MKKKKEIKIEESIQEVKNLSKMTVALVDCMIEFASSQLELDEKIPEHN